jgi:hypothetical protein
MADIGVLARHHSASHGQNLTRRCHQQGASNHFQAHCEGANFVGRECKQFEPLAVKTTSCFSRHRNQPSRSKTHLSPSTPVSTFTIAANLRHRPRRCAPLDSRLLSSRLSSLKATSPGLDAPTHTGRVDRAQSPSPRMAADEPSTSSRWSWHSTPSTKESLFREWPEAPRGGCHICAPLTAKYVSEMVAQMHEAKAAGATMVEVRLDHMYGWLLVAPRSGESKVKEDLKALLKDRPLPVILTYRPEWEGGKYEGDELDRLRLLWDAMDLDVDYVDIELSGIKKDVEKEAYKEVYDSYYVDLRVPTPRRVDMLHKYDIEFEVSARCIECVIVPARWVSFLGRTEGLGAVVRLS